MKRLRYLSTACLFLLLLCLYVLTPATLSAAPRQCVWTGVEKIIAIGDLHGDYENFVKILKGTALVNEDLRWAAGKTHLVQMGDIMDRGPDAKKIFDLIKTLEEEAEESGGKVHMLIGNHEEINIIGLVFRYEDFMTPEQFVSFLPENYVADKEKKFKEKSGGQADVKEFWKNVIKTDEAAQERYKDSFNEHYGRWIAEHNAVVKINDTVFVHGGLSESYSARKLETLNSLLSSELYKAILGQPYRRGILYEANGPLWYRDLARKDERLIQEEFERTLANLGAKYIVIAHSPISSEVAPEFMNRFEKRLWMIDTRISDYMPAGGRLSALVIENGNFSVWGGNHEKNHSWNLSVNPVPFLWDWQPHF